MSSIPDDFDSSKLKDRKWKGEDITMNKDIARSPTNKPRRCTDILCCILFTAFVTGMLVSAIYGYAAGEPWKLIAPIDGENRVCGYDDAVKDYPKLYIDNIVQAIGDIDDAFSYGVCVKECPSSADDTIKCVNTAKVGDCQPAEGEGYGTTEILSYCYPEYDTLPQAAKDEWDSVQDQFSANEYGSGIFAELSETKWVILLSCAIALVCTLVYIKFMDWCAFWLSWLSVLLVLASFIGAGIGAMQYRNDRLENDTDGSYADSSEHTWINFTIWMSFITAGIYLLVMICYFQSLRVAIAVIETAADFFADTKRILFVPLLYFFVGILVFCMWIAGLICVASVGNIEADSYESQTKNIEWDSFTTWSVWYMGFGIIWLITFIIACNEFVVIVSAITWYYSDKTVPDDDGIPGDSDVSTGFKWTFRYHMGSLAFGSLILSIVWIIRALFEYVGEKVIDAAPGNGCTKCLLACVHCCLDCFDRFLRFLTRNAYIYMALSGEGFCSSALNAFVLILKNAAKFSFVDGIADVFMFLAKFFIASATTALSWLLMGPMTDC